MAKPMQTPKLVGEEWQPPGRVDEMQVICRVRAIENPHSVCLILAVSDPAAQAFQLDGVAKLTAQPKLPPLSGLK